MSYVLATANAQRVFQPAIAILLLVSLCLVSARTVIAEEKPQGAETTLEIYTAALPPYVTTDKNGVLVGSLVSEVRTYVEARGFTPNVTLLPWSAAYRRTIAHPQALLYPVDRIAAREDKFHWIKPLVTTQYYLYGLKGRANPAATLREVIARGELVSCTHNSVQCEILLANGVPAEQVLRIEGASIRRRLALMVAERNYYTVFDPEVFAYLTISQSLPSQQLEQLEKVGEMSSYLAASKNMPADLLEKLR